MDPMPATKPAGSWLPEEPRHPVAQVQQAATLIDDGDGLTAISMLDARIQQQADDADAWYWRGKAKAATGDAPGAEADLKQAIELAPTWFLAREALCDVLLPQRRCADALPHLEAETRLHPEIGPAWANLGFCRRQSGDADGGYAALSKACELKYVMACEAVSKIDERKAKVAAQGAGSPATPAAAPTAASTAAPPQAP